MGAYGPQTSRVEARGAEPVTGSAVAKINALMAVSAGIVVLCLATLVGALFATQQQSVAIAAEREQAQVRDAMDAKLSDMRSDLASITFWDEAVESTAIRFDAQWAQANVGEWLRNFYGVDRSFVVDGSGRVLMASADGKPAAPATFQGYARVAQPLIAEVRSGTSRYKPGQPAGTYGALSPDAKDRLDSARLVMAGGKPELLVVAPILPDFGRVPRPAHGYAILVAVYRIDSGFFAELGQSLLLSGIHFSPASTALRDGEGRLAMTTVGKGPQVEVRWFQQARGTDLIRRSLPSAAALMLALIVGGIAGLRFVRDSARALYISRVEALHDELTGLPNRRQLTRQIDEMLAAHARAALIFVDLDRFKQVNDLWGHAEGDRLIREAAERLVAVCGQEATVARFGGDEFVLLVPGSRQSAEAIGADVLQSLRRPFRVGESAIVLAGSAGLALAPEHGTSASELMRKADLALFRAKALGKDRLLTFDATMDAALKARQSLEQDLHAAVAREELSVAYQPLFGRDDRRPVGVEALARWRRPDGALVEPGTFVPLAEEIGLVSKIDAQILRQAACDAVRWPGLVLAVNVSAGQLHWPGYADFVLGVLAESGLAPQRLRVEITESALLGHAARVAETMIRLRSAGVRFALDDFGTGFSSLERLRTLRLDGMKIDRSFVTCLGQGGGNCEALISSMVGLGHALGLTVTAEGVETRQQLTLLQMAGCDEFQGNHLGLPRGAADIGRLLETEAAGSAA